MAISRNRPAAGLTDNLNGGAPGRASWYGDAYVVPVGTQRGGVADEGSYFAISNAVPATTIAGHVAPAIADNDDTPTKALLHIYNGGQRHVTMDFLKIKLAVVNASSTATGFTGFLDNLGSSGRSSGGTAITPQNTRSDNPYTSGATVYFGAVVTVAASSVRKFLSWQVRPVIAVVDDRYDFFFGSEPNSHAPLAVTGTAIAQVAVACPPVVIAPGGNFYLCEVNPSGAATAATYEFTGGFWER